MNLFQLSIEKIIVALVMTLIIINGEIDLSVASMMGLSACVLAWLFQMGVPVPVGILAALAAGALAGPVQRLLDRLCRPAVAGGHAGRADRLPRRRAHPGRGSRRRRLPGWFNALGQQPLLGPLTLSLIIFFILLRRLRRRAPRLGLRPPRLRHRQQRRGGALFGRPGQAGEDDACSSRPASIAALAGLLYAARLGSVRGDMAEGFELDIITIVLLGGVSIFGGSGNLLGRRLSILIILNLRNGMGLANITGNTQTSVIGALLILSVLVPNLT